MVDPALVADPVLLQRRLALQNADAVRFFRAGAKKALAKGELAIEDVLLEPHPMLRGMKVYEILRAAPGVGPKKASRALRRAKVSESLVLGSLSMASRRRILDELPAKCLSAAA